VSEGVDPGSAGGAGALCRAATPLALCVALAAVKLWLVSAQTLAAVAPAPVDDDLFVSTAEALLRGEWLGPPDLYTLAKGPVYPLWLALVHGSGLRLLVAQAALYALSCAAFVWALAPAVSGRWLRAAIFLVVLWNPASWADGPATQVLRDGIYPALTLLVVAGTAGTVLRLTGRVAGARRWAAAAGLAGALFAMTREEGIWILPSVGVLAFAAMIHTRRIGLRRILGAAAIAGAAYSAPVAAVAAANAARYGVFTICDTNAPELRAAYGALTRVVTPAARPLVPVPREARARIAAASPAFREVYPVLEARAPGWQVHGCAALGICDEISGGWFNWALREAASLAGKYDDLTVARDWYARVASEVDEACSRGALVCLPPRASLMPPWRHEYLRRSAEAFGRGAALVATLSSVRAEPSRPITPERWLRRFEAVTNEQIPRDRLRVRVQVESALGSPRPVVLDGDFQQRPATIAVIPTNATPAGAPGRYRVEAETSCGRDCLLVNLFPGGAALAVPLEANASQGADGNGSWVVEQFEVVPELPSGAQSARWAALDAVGRIYRVALPPLLAVAVALCVWAAWGDLRARSLRPLTAVVAALAAGVLARLLVLALVDATSFPAIRVFYAAPAYPLAIGFVALSLASLWLPVPRAERTT
jgi:hypothetical protein